MSDFRLVPLAAVTSQIQYGYTAKSSSSFSGPRYVRITDIQNGEIDWDTVPHCEISSSDLHNYALHDGDILFARSGATVGKSFLIREERRDAVFAS